MSIVSQAYKLAYEKSPIFLTDGIASFVPGNILPLIAITEAVSLATSAIAGNISLNLDDFYATFWPLPGSTLHENQIGNYPFANQQVAANAIITQPLRVSMRMNCTPRLQGAMVSRIMTATALKLALDNHNLSGGTYSVLTPSYLYQGCILTSFKDITSGDSKHQQTDWQLDFVQPLLSLSAAESVQNSTMSKFTHGLKL